MKKILSVSVKERTAGKLYIIKWQEENGEERQCKSFEFPRPELENTMEALAEYVPYITYIPKENIRQCVVAGVNLEHKEDGFIGVSLGISLIMQNLAAFELKTPAVEIALEYADIDDLQNWESRFAALVVMLQNEAEMYIEGKRAQTKFAFEGAENNGKSIS